MQKYFHFLLAFLVISILIAGESEAENETNDDETNDDETNDDETNDDETNDDESNETTSNDNETSDNNETKEQSGFCPTEITDENKDTVDDACIVPLDESEDTNSKEEGLLPSISLFASICAIAIIAFRRR
jgi:cytoskeletal protein RodZ